jgi:flavin reductase (DIM6/NTAB) family NADH-FMN oxidoreductase RutF
MSDDPIRDVLRLMPYGFYSITSRHEEDVNAMVANWVSQVSFEPRLIAMGLQKTSYSHGLISAGKVFAINLFQASNADAIKPFTKGRSKNPEKMADAAYTEGPETGCPVLMGAAAYLECKVVDIIDVGGDHDLLVGEVVGAGIISAGDVTETLGLPDLGWSYAG